MMRHWVGYAITIIWGSTIILAYPFSIPSESYLRFKDFLAEKTATPSPITIQYAPSDWIKLVHAPPVIGQFQINPNTVVSVSVFDGPIGNEEANVNRWRRQIGLSPLPSWSPTMMDRSTWNGFDRRTITITHNNTELWVIWLSHGNQHIFVKTTGTPPIQRDPIWRMIEQQSWTAS